MPAYAIAEFPSADNAGYRIRVNTSYTLTESQKIFILTHELGHCLGFRHTNWASDGEPSQPVGAYQISGTPTTDSQSIMNSGSAFSGVPNWSGFSTYDVIAAQTLYPFSAYDNWLADVTYFSIYNNDIPPAITWNNALVYTNTVSIELFQFGASKGIIAQNVPNNGSFSVDYSYLLPGSFTKCGVQLKIIADDNPNITDMTRMFYFYQD